MWKIRVEIHLCPYIKYGCHRADFQLMFAQQLFAKEFYSECDKNPSDCLVTDTRSWTDSFHLSVFFKIYYKDSRHSMFKDKLQNCSLKQSE